MQRTTVVSVHTVPQDVADRITNPNQQILQRPYRRRKCRLSPYSETALVSWNCILVPGVTSTLPAVTPRDLICAVCAVVAPCGWTLPVSIATLRPFTEIDVSATLSGADPPPGLELERGARILPVTFVPALNTVAPLTTTFWSTCAVKVLPTGSLSEI